MIVEPVIPHDLSIIPKIHYSRTYALDTRDFIWKMGTNLDHIKN